MAVLVLGIVGMHALASHGTPVNTDSSSGMASISGMGSRMADGGEVGPAGNAFLAPANQADEADLQTDTAPRQTFGQPTADGNGHGQGSEHGPDRGMSMLMLCVFILTAALTLLALAVVGIRRLRLPAAFWPAGGRDKILRWVRGTGPPHEWQFSVIRC